MGDPCLATASVNEVVQNYRERGAKFVMSDGPRASKDVNYLFPLAEKELSAFVHAVDQLFGSEQAQRSALDWIHEMEVMNWPDGEAIPNWRKATIRASTQLGPCIPSICDRVRRKSTAEENI